MTWIFPEPTVYARRALMVIRNPLTLDNTLALPVAAVAAIAWTATLWMLISTQAGLFPVILMILLCAALTASALERLLKVFRKPAAFSVGPNFRRHVGCWHQPNHRLSPNLIVHTVSGRTAWHLHGAYNQDYVHTVVER